MNDQSAILPMDYVRDDWNNNTHMVESAQQSAYSVNQNLVDSGIVFHDYVQQDMGLNPGGVWYPTYDMADGKVPTGGGDAPMTAQPDPAKVDSKVDYQPEPTYTPAPATKPVPTGTTTYPPQKTDGAIDYDMLQRSIKR